METGAIELVDYIRPVITVSLILVMFGLGTSLNMEDFRRLIKEPKNMVLGLFNQVLVLPAIGFLFIYFFDLYVNVAVGVILILSCPGGNMSNLLTHFARGDLALSISLTAVSTCLSVILLPLWLMIGFLIIGADSGGEDYSMWGTVIQVFTTTVIPVLVGMLSAMRFPGIVKRIERITRIFAISFLVIVMAGVIFQDPSGIVNNITDLVPLGFVLTSVLMIYGYQSARFFDIKAPQRRTIALETGIQNVPLALTVASVSLNNLEAAVFPTLYGFAMIVVGVLFTVLVNMRKGKAF